MPFEENSSNRLRISFCRVFLPFCRRSKLRSRSPQRCACENEEFSRRQNVSNERKAAEESMPFEENCSNRLRISFCRVFLPFYRRSKLRSRSPQRCACENEEFSRRQNVSNERKQRKNRCHLKRTAAIGFGFHSVASSYHSVEDPNCDRGLRSAAPAKMKNFHDVKMSVMSAKQRKNRCHLKRTAAIGFGFHSVASSYHSIDDLNCD